MDGLTDKSRAELELKAMQAVLNALDTLPPEAATRVLRWVAETLGLGQLPSVRKNTEPMAASGVETQTTGDNAGSPQGRQYPDLVALFSAAEPKVGPEKALLVAYWKQVVEGATDFEAASINRELKNLGHAAANITSTLGLLEAQKPALVVQTRKSGNTKQARKLYRLTSEGIKRARGLLPPLEA